MLSFQPPAALYDGEHRTLTADIDLCLAVVHEARARGPVLELVETSFELARIERLEIEAALYAAGFDVVAALGDHRGSPHSGSSPRLVVHAERPG